MNALTSSSADTVLTEALTAESISRAANLKSATVRNVLYGSAALVGAALIGWAAWTWADNQRLDPDALKTSLQAALANLPPLKVEPVQIAEDSTVALKDGGEVALKDGGIVRLDPDATVAVKGRLDSPAPTLPPPPTSRDGHAIKREVIVFTESTLDPSRSVTTGWTFADGGATVPKSQFCYLSTIRPDGRIERTDIGADRTFLPQARNLLPNADALFQKCVWFSGRL